MDEENVEAVRQAVLSQVRAEAQEMLEEAEAEAESLREEARSDAESERARLLQQARGEDKALREQTVAEARIQAQRVRLSRREQLLDRVFDAAREQLHAVPDSTDYPELVRRLVREAIEHLDSDEAVVRIDDRTRRALGDRLSGLLESVGGELEVHLTVGEPLQDRTGVVIQTPDGHRHYDNTLEARLARMEETLRAPVYRILTEGES